MKQRTHRRDFLKTSALTGAGVLILSSARSARTYAANGKLNVAVIGVSGRGGSNLGDVSKENIVALCDVNEQNLAGAAKRFPEAKTYADWRKCLDQKDIDAVVCSTPDHIHAFVNVWAMNRGKHGYCEKPLANSVHEARTVRETYLKNKDKIATQMGTQMHATDNFRRIVELVRQGAIGALKDCHVWCSRTPKGGEYLPATTQPAPEGLDWELWIGPSPMHPYNPGYVGGCLAWNRFWDFGSGQIGDMGSHMIDMAYWALDLRFPTTCEAEGTPVSTDTCPEWLKATWDHPANDWRPAVKLYWYDGGKKPGMPMDIFDREKLFKGIWIRGDKGWLLGDYGWRILRPDNDLTYYKAPKKEELIPPSLGHHKEWIQACKGDKTTLCNFDYSGAMIENNLLALAAYRTGETVKRKGKDNKEEEVTTSKKLEWDSKELKAANCPEVDQYIKKTYREGWVLDG